MDSTSARARRNDGAVLIIDALAARFGGTAYAMIQVAGALRDRSDVSQVHVVTQRDSIVDRGLRRDAIVHVTQLPAPASTELPWRVAWEATRLPRLVARVAADAVFSASGIQPRPVGCRFISLLANPVPYMDRQRPANALRRAAIRWTARNATAVYVPSTHMATLVGPDLSPQVVPLGVDRNLFKPTQPGTEILYVADFYRHKRHDLALDAWRLLPEPRPVLRFVGNPEVDPNWFESLRARTADPGVVIRPNVGLAELLEAYSQARLLIVPSERESFSMPLAEAMCSGVPALVSDDPALRETGGPGAMRVADQSPETWASMLHEVLNDDELHRRLRSAAIDHGRRYSWEDMAARIVADAVDGLNR